jgi:hypothetical protein
MEELIRTNVMDNEGTEQSCLLIEKSNNQNGGTLYTFAIDRHDHTWKHLNGELPHRDCVQQLGDFLDQFDER